MSGLIMAAQLLAGLSLLIVLHELGHFWAARAFGIKVEKFYLFFDAWGFKLFSFKYGDTEYGIGWLPLGGYVKIAGMIDESMDTEQMKQPVKDWEFRSKPAWQRLIVMLGGVTVNVILGIFIFWVLTFTYGDTDINNQKLKNGVVALELAEDLGIQSGDKIIAVGQDTIQKFSEILGPKVLMGNVDLTIQRGDSTLLIPVPSNFIEKVSDSGPGKFLSPRSAFVVESVMTGSNAEKAGLLAGDRILAVDSVFIPFYDQISPEFAKRKGEEVMLLVVRGNDTLEFPVLVSTEGTIGFYPKLTDIEFIEEKYSASEAFPMGAQKAWDAIWLNLKGFGKIFSGDVRADKAIQGPIGIASIYGGTFDWERFWSLTALISMILAFMNLLPIPALDGGHAMFLILEILRGKPLSDSVMEKAQTVGFFILIGLMVFAFGNDIFKLFK